METACKTIILIATINILLNGIFDLLFNHTPNLYFVMLGNILGAGTILIYKKIMGD